MVTMRALRVTTVVLTLLSLTEVGRAWAAEADRAGRPAPPEGSFLVDATGQRIGPLLQTTLVPPPLAGTLIGYAAQVGLRVGGRSVTLWANRERFLGLELMPVPIPPLFIVLYDGAACTGNAFVFGFVDQPAYAPRLAPFAAIGSGQKLFIGEGAPQAVVTLSRWDVVTSTCLGGVAVFALPAVEAADLDALFLPPYRVE